MLTETYMNMESKGLGNTHSWEKFKIVLVEKQERKLYYFMLFEFLI